MSVRDSIMTIVSAALMTPLVLFSLQVTSAQVRQSASFQIESDSINFGGGLGTSTNYTLESTAGEVGTGESSSATYALKAGYQQMVTRFISMSAPASVAMTPSIVGITGGESNGSTSVTIITDSAAGYALTIEAESSPAMVKGSDTIADYAPSGNPDYTFTTASDDAHFGYSPSSIDVVQRFQDNGGVCNVSGTDTLLACWDGLDTVAETIVQGSAGNAPNGATTTIYFRVGIGGGVSQPAGAYTATTTLTAIAL